MVITEDFLGLKKVLFCSPGRLILLSRKEIFMLTFLETQGARRYVLQLAIWPSCSREGAGTNPKFILISPHKIFDEQGSI